MRCWGRTRTLSRCKNKPRYPFCRQHRLQAFFVIFATINAVAMYAGLYRDLIEPIFVQPIGIEEVSEHSYRVRFLTVPRLSNFSYLVAGSGSKGSYLVPSPAHTVLRQLLGAYPELANHEAKIDSCDSRDMRKLAKVFTTDPHYYVAFGRSLPRPYHGEQSEGEPHYNPYPWYTNSAEEIGGIVSQETYVEDFKGEDPFMLGFVGAQNIDNVIGEYDPPPSFYRDLMKVNPRTPDIAMEEVAVSECDGSFRLFMRYRPLEIVVLDLENISQAPIEIRTVEGYRFDRNSLVMTPWNGKAEERGGVFVKYDFPPGLLLPGEHILVPLKLVLKAFSDFSMTPLPEFFLRDHPPAKIALLGQQVINVPAKPRRSNSLHNEYILGSWVEVVTINGREQIRSFNSSNVVYEDIEGIGSCPLALIRSSAADKWTQIGTLITDNIGKQRKGKSSLNLPVSFDGKLLIREVEDEISFLDFIELHAEEVETGDVRVFRPDISELRAADDKFLVLRRGDERLVNFTGLATGNFKTLTLVSEGYYLPKPSLGRRAPLSRP